MLISINGVDFTEYVNDKGYNINQTDVYGNTAWVDANYLKHRNVVRTEVAGDITMTFTSETDYNTFLNTVKSGKVAGHNPVTLYVNNLNQTKTINAYLKIDSNVVRTTKSFGREFGVASVTITVEER